MAKISIKIDIMKSINKQYIKKKYHLIFFSSLKYFKKILFTLIFDIPILYLEVELVPTNYNRNYVIRDLIRQKKNR